MSPTDYTLDDLVQATGFSKRQIRFYITKKLVPGAGDSRGPNATYGEETLQRLRLIGVLKEKRIEPTGRTMTLDEIGHALDTLSTGGIESLLSGRAELAILDTDAGVREPLGSAADYVAFARSTVSEPGPMLKHAPLFHVGRDEPPGPEARNEVLESRAEPPALRKLIDRTAHRVLGMMSPESLAYTIGGEHPTREDDDLSDLLGRLQALLAELALDSRFTDQATDHQQWLRVTTPDVEFHVRKPDDHLARARLAAMAEALARLLERED